MKNYYVVGFMFSEDYKKVALIRKNKPEFMVGLLNGIGGKIELLDDSPFAAMIREFKEEAGVEVRTWEQYCKLTNNRYDVYVYRTTGDLSTLKSMEEEQIEIVTVAHIGYEKILDNLHWLIPMALDKNINESLVTYRNE